jgi:uncharacterized membrane protein (Fun14 family)
MLNEGQVATVNLQEQAVNTGLIESLKNAMQPEAIANKLGMDKNMLIDIGLYGAIGFIMGFLLKKYSEYFIALALLIVGIVVLQQFDYISVSINMPKIHQMLGLEPAPVVGDKYGTLLLEWIKANIAGSASLVVGFLIGLKVG